MAGGKLNGNVAVVTGASSGICEATAIAHATQGTKVAIAVIRTEINNHIPNAIAKQRTQEWRTSVAPLQSEGSIWQPQSLDAVTQPQHINVNEILI